VLQLATQKRTTEGFRDLLEEGCFFVALCAFCSHAPSEDISRVATADLGAVAGDEVLLFLFCFITI